MRPKASATSTPVPTKLEPPSEEEKAKVGVGSLIAPEGPESIVVWGGKDSNTLRTRLLTLSAMYTLPEPSTVRSTGSESSAEVAGPSCPAFAAGCGWAGLRVLPSGAR